MLARVMQLTRGRTLSVDGDLLEIHNAAGTLELRVRLTDDGVVLQLEGARISLKADESIDLECKTFNVAAESDINIESTDGDLKVRGQRVWIN